MTEYLPDNFLALFRQHVRADDLAGVDDAVMQQYLDAAEQSVFAFTEREAADLIDTATGKYPAPVVQAVLLLAGLWYSSREAASDRQTAAVPFGVVSLLSRYRKTSKA